MDNFYPSSTFNTTGMYREMPRINDEQSYFLDELEKDPASQNFGEVKLNLGVCSFLNHARNFLDGKVYSAEHKGTYNYRHNELLWGIRFQHEQFSDQIKEWNYYGDGNRQQRASSRHTTR